MFLLHPASANTSFCGTPKPADEGTKFWGHQATELLQEQRVGSSDQTTSAVRPGAGHPAGDVVGPLGGWWRKQRPPLLRAQGHPVESWWQSAARTQRQAARLSSLPAPLSRAPLLCGGLALSPSQRLPPHPPSRTPAQGAATVPTRAAPVPPPPLPQHPCLGVSWGAGAGDQHLERFSFPSALCDDLLARQRRRHPCLPAAERRLSAGLMNRGECCQLLKIKGTRRYCCRQEYHQLHRDLYYLIMYIKLLQTSFKPDSALTCTDVRLLPIYENPPTRFFYSVGVFPCSLVVLGKVPVCATASQCPEINFLFHNT